MFLLYVLYSKIEYYLVVFSILINRELTFDDCSQLLTPSQLVTYFIKLFLTSQSFYTAFVALSQLVTQLLELEHSFQFLHSLQLLQS